MKPKRKTHKPAGYIDGPVPPETFVAWHVCRFTYGSCNCEQNRQSPCDAAEEVADSVIAAARYQLLTSEKPHET